MNPLFVALAGRLQQTRGAWPGDPVATAQGLRVAAWQLELPRSDTFAAERLVVETATALGLVAYDDQVGIGFLPGGDIVPAERRAIWDESIAAAEAGELRDASSVRALLLATLPHTLSPHGFMLQPEGPAPVEVRLDFARTLHSTRQAIELRVLWDTHCQITFSVWHEAVDRAYEQVLGKAAWRRPALVLEAGFFAPGPETHRHWVIRNPLDVEGVVALMDSLLLPFADLCRDLGGLDQVMNDASAGTIRTAYKTGRSGPARPPGGECTSSLLDEFCWNQARLVVAHLNGNPEVAAIAACLAERFGEGHAWHDEYRRLRDGLRNVAPVASWPDAAAHRASLRQIPASMLCRPTDARERRPHHHEATALLLTQALESPAGFWSRFGTPDGAAELDRMWRETAETYLPGDRVAPDGLDCRVETAARAWFPRPLEVLLLQFPAAGRLDEIARLAVARMGEKHRVCFLGNSFELDAGDVIRPFIAIVDQGVRSTHVLREFDPDNFVDFICECWKKK